MDLSIEETDHWHHFYNKLAEFHKKHGHCNIPSDDHKYRELAKWMLIQRKAQHRLPAHLLKKLKVLDFEFSGRHSSDWQMQFEALESFFVKHGHAHVPATDHQYAELHDWLMSQVRNSEGLNERQKAKLDSLGVHWEFRTLRDWKWHEMYLQLKSFYKKYGHCNVPQKWDKNLRLAHWVTVQRRRFSEKNLKKERKRKLDAMGFVWDFKEVYESQWLEKYDQLLKFKKEHGHCRVPLTYADQQLAGWIDRQRTLKSKGRLSEYREQKLEKIGFIWNCAVLQEEVWQRRFKELLEYKKQFGDCQVPVNWKQNRHLGIWVSTQRTLEKRGKLDAGKKKKLNAVGFVWAREAWKLQLKKYDQQWERNYRKLKDYQKQHGDIQVSVRVDPALERWTCIQRKQKQTGQLSAQRISKLDKLGFPWDIHESYWMKMYEKLVRFKQKYGHTRVPFRWNRNPQLGQWVSRTRLRQYELTSEQIELLNKINFDWHTIHKNPVPWTEMFERLVEFKNKYGHTRVPLKWPQDRKLGKWASRMRSDQDKLPKERRERLEKIGFDWQKRMGRPRKEKPVAEVSTMA